MKTILVTGVAGFVGQKTAQLLLRDGINVVGIDNLNEYYDIRLKEYRLSQLTGNNGFKFIKSKFKLIFPKILFFKIRKVSPWDLI